MVDVLDGGAPVQDGETQHEALLDDGWAQVDRAIGVDRIPGRPAQVVVIEHEGDDRQIGHPPLIDSLDGREPVVGMLCQVETRVERLPEGCHAVEMQRQPDGEAAGRPGQLGPERGYVPYAHVAVVVPQVGAAPLMGIDQRGLVPRDEGTNAEGDRQPLVRVEGDGVCPLDPGESRPTAIGQLEKTAVRPVDVHPQPLIGGEVGDLGQRVDCAGVSRAGRGDHQERVSSLLPVRLHQLLQVGEAHPQLGVDVDHGDLVGAETGESGGLGGRVMGVPRHIEDSVTEVVPELCVARGDDPREVRRRAPRQHQPRCLRPEVEQGRHPVDDPMLDGGKAGCRC